jgi:hypothetical protein
MDNRWTYWAGFHYFYETLDDGGVQQHLDANVKNDPIVGYPIPGGPLDLEDPALRVFLRLCGLPSEITVETELYDVIRGVKRWHRVELLDKGIEGYDCSGFDELFALRDVGQGWTEIDRLTKTLCCTSFTGMANQAKQWIWFSDSDPQPGNDQLVTAKVYTSRIYTNDRNMDDVQRALAGAIASDYEHILLAMTQQIKKINDQATEFGLRADCPLNFTIQKNGNNICHVYLKQKIEGGKYSTDIDYDRFLWDRHDQVLLKAMLKVFPKHQKYKIQAGIFSSELGL